jgi:hypothetical protein
VHVWCRDEECFAAGPARGKLNREKGRENMGKCIKRREKEKRKGERNCIKLLFESNCFARCDANHDCFFVSERSLKGIKISKREKEERAKRKMD